MRRAAQNAFVLVAIFLVVTSPVAPALAVGGGQASQDQGPAKNATKGSGKEVGNGLSGATNDTGKSNASAGTPGEVRNETAAPANGTEPANDTAAPGNNTTATPAPTKPGKPKENASKGKPRNNVRDLNLTIGDTEEAPRDLKLRALDDVRGLDGSGEDDHRLAQAADLINESLNESLWLDDRHVSSPDVFRYEARAAQKLRTLINREKPSPLDPENLSHPLRHLVTADRELAETSLREAERVAETLSGDRRTEFETRIADATRQMELARKHVDDGVYVTAINNYRKAWNSTYPFLLELDEETDPTVTITEPLNGTYTNTSPVPVSGNVSDTLIYLIPNTSVRVTGENYSENHTLTLINGSFSGDAELREGRNRINVSVEDLFGNPGSDQVVVILDTVPPGIDVSGVENGTYYNHSVTPLVNVTDLHLEGYNATLNGSPFLPGTNVSDEAHYALNVSARDLAGNRNSSTTMFVIDRTPPELSINRPSDDAYLRRTVEINSSATDIHLNRTILSIDGEQVTNATAYTWNTSPYEDGIHHIVLGATDLAGNRNSTSVEVTVDNTAPEVNVTSPARYYLRGEVEIDASVVEEHPGEVSVMVDGEEVASTLPFTLDTERYSDGNHTVEVYATDMAGNVGGQGVEVRFDNTVPEVDISAPLDGDFVRKEVSVNGSAVDENLLGHRLSVDGVNVSSSLPFDWDTYGYDDGNHTLRLTAVDKAGNRNSTAVVVTVDNTAPKVDLSFPPNGSTVNGVIEIVFGSFDRFLRDIRLFIDGEQVASGSDLDSFSWNTSMYDDGPHVVRVEVEDEAGNVNSTEVNVSVDNTPPRLNVSELVPVPVYNHTYALLVETERNASVTVNNESIILVNGSGVFSGNVSLGVNTFTVEARDQVGNPSTWSTRFLVDRDVLPEWYERNVTGTDPLDGDSDSAKTSGDESDNKVPDGEEDFDSDGLSNREEFGLGTDPFVNDTDGDGLTDFWESRITRTNPLESDSDGNGVPDGEEDPDNDSLINMVEQSAPSNPLANDTDGDGLTDDVEVRELGTSPVGNDTDEDGLEDATELKEFFGTDPTDPDTDGDGVLDGDETYRQTVGDESLGVDVVIDSSVDREGTFRFEDAGGRPALRGVVKGSAVDVEATDEFDEVALRLYYDESGLGDTPEEDLGIMYYNETSHRLEPVPDQRVNASGNYVEATVTHLSTFTVVDLESYFEDFLATNDPHEPVFAKGQTLRIKAKVHNLEESVAEDVEVRFYEGGKPGSGGTQIGTDILPRVPGNDWRQASVTWTVPEDQEIEVYVEADPENVVAETDESNNGALRRLGLKALDSDGDGLSNWDEINGLRTATGKTVYTDPRDPDTDGDGLNDGEEMGELLAYSTGRLSGERYYFLQSYPSTDVEGAVVDGSTDTDGDGLSDQEEYEIGTDGFVSDSDGDGLIDYDEVYDYHTHPLEYTHLWDGSAESGTNNEGLLMFDIMTIHQASMTSPQTLNLLAYSYGYEVEWKNLIIPVGGSSWVNGEIGRVFSYNLPDSGVIECNLDLDGQVYSDAGINEFTIDLVVYDKNGHSYISETLHAKEGTYTYQNETLTIKSSKIDFPEDSFKVYLKFRGNATAVGDSTASVDFSDRYEVGRKIKVNRIAIS